MHGDVCRLYGHKNVNNMDYKFGKVCRECKKQTSIEV